MLEISFPSVKTVLSPKVTWETKKYISCIFQDFDMEQTSDRHHSFDLKHMIDHVDLLASSNGNLQEFLGRFAVECEAAGRRVRTSISGLQATSTIMKFHFKT